MNQRNLDNYFNLPHEIIKSHIKANMMDILSTEEVYEIYVKPNFETACWYWDFSKSANKIYIGDGIFDRTIEGYNNKEKILLSYLVHEAAHSIFTTKNLQQLSAKLKEEKLNFQLYNLFEDARIEHKIREYFGYEFNWNSFEEVPEDSFDEKATTTLFKIIQTEDKQVFDVPYYEKVKNYYQKIVNAQDENEMIKIMLQWNQDFPNDTKPENNKNMSQSMQNDSSNSEDNSENKDKSNVPSNSENDESSDLELAAQLQSDPDLANEFEEDSKMVIGDAKKQLEELEEELLQNNEIKFLEPVEAGNEILETSTSTDIFTYKEFDKSKIFEDKLNKAEDRLRRILKSVDIETINSTSHDKKFNIKGVVQALSGHPNAKPYKKNVEEDYEETKKKVFILMDGSGSMSGLPQKNMLTFCTVVNRLANLNLFEGWIGGCKMDRRGKSKTQAFQLPINDGFITSFEANAESEGIGAAIETHIESMKIADYIFVLTDGNIHDKDLTFLKYNYQDIFEKTIGIYMGKRKHSNIADMANWFDKTIIKDKFEDVIEEIVSFLDPNSNSNQKLYELDVKNHTELENFEASLNLNRI